MVGTKRLPRPSRNEPAPPPLAGSLYCWTCGRVMSEWFAFHPEYLRIFGMMCGIQSTLLQFYVELNYVSYQNSWPVHNQFDR